jgi:hypothetical protein
MANGFTPPQQKEFAFHFPRREPVLSEEEKRRMNLDYTVRDLLDRGFSAYQIIRHIFPEPAAQGQLFQRRDEIRIVNRLIQEHNKQIPRQEEDRQKYLERIVTELLIDGYSILEIYSIIWSTDEPVNPTRDAEIVERIIRLRINMTPEQLEAEKLISGIGPATNKYLKYKNKYLQLKNKIFNL